jgi:histidine triad (HIT) family protein
MTSSPDCIFCKIIQGGIPAARVFENESFLCIRDIQPQAKTHLLVMPKEHLASLEEAVPASGPARIDLMGRLMETGVRVARQEGLLPGGFRSVINTGRNGNQTVHHIHLHILGGEELSGSLA